MRLPAKRTTACRLSDTARYACSLYRPRAIVNLRTKGGEPPGGQPRHPDRERTARLPWRQHHDDLRPRPQPGSGRCPERGRPDVPGMTSRWWPNWRRLAPVISCGPSLCYTAKAPGAVQQPRERSSIARRPRA